MAELGIEWRGWEGAEWNFYNTAIYDIFLQFLSVISFEEKVNVYVRMQNFKFSVI